MNEFITIDFETATYSSESAISLGLVKYQNYQPIASYYTLIRPPRLYIRRDFTEIHGLRIEDVQDAPDFHYLWEHELQGFFSTIPLAAHNASFDMNVLRSTLMYYRIPLPGIAYFCSLQLSRRVWPDLHSHTLAALADEFNIGYNAHHALADAETCGKIISLCAMELGRRKSRKQLPAIIDVLKNLDVKMKNLRE